MGRRRDQTSDGPKTGCCNVFYQTKPIGGKWRLYDKDELRRAPQFFLLDGHVAEVRILDATTAV